MVFWMCWQLNLFSQVSTLPLDHISAPFTSITNQCLFTQINVFFRRRQTFPVHQESKVLGKSHTLTNSSKVKLQLNSLFHLLIYDNYAALIAIAIQHIYLLIKNKNKKTFFSLVLVKVL